MLEKNHRRIGRRNLQVARRHFMQTRCILISQNLISPRARTLADKTHG
jgi:chemotaxis receptor (MCP) glutamine deamidase CheD